MAIDIHKKDRNAEKARDSFVTKRAESKLSALTTLFQDAAGDENAELTRGTLSRTLTFERFRYLDSLSMQYNWENRFLSVNYNLEMNAVFRAPEEIFQECGDAVLRFHCDQKGLRGSREYSWEAAEWDEEQEILDETLDRLQNPLIKDRLSVLDLFEGELRHQMPEDGEEACWTLRFTSLIGSASWLLIPPVTSMVKPSESECIRFYELYELIGDAVVNNRN